MFHDRRRILINKVPTMTIETTSTSSSWSPSVVNNTGDIFTWEVTGGVTIPPIEINEPTFDLSTNTGTAIITAKDVSALTRLELVNSVITSIDLTKATNLSVFSSYQDGFNSVDLSENVNLTQLAIILNNFTSIDISNNPLLNSLRLNNNSLTSVDISNNPLLDFVFVRANPLTSTSIDNLLIDLDNHGLSNGTANIPLGRTSASDTAFYNLETVKNWNIIPS